MTQVTAASDIWSVGCLIIELLTGYPPYYDLQPMSALFRIVQDDHPPLPETISSLLEDFLLKCFQKVGHASCNCLYYIVSGATTMSFYKCQSEI